MSSHPCGNVFRRNLRVGLVDRYCHQRVARLGDSELNIRIKPLDFKVNVKEEGEIQLQEFETVFPQHVAVKEQVAFEENIPEDQLELVKNYFNKLAQE